MQFAQDKQNANTMCCLGSKGFNIVHGSIHRVVAVVVNPILVALSLLLFMVAPGFVEAALLSMVVPAFWLASAFVAKSSRFL